MLEEIERLVVRFQNQIRQLDGADTDRLALYNRLLDEERAELLVETGSNHLDMANTADRSRRIKILEETADVIILLISLALLFEIRPHSVFRAIERKAQSNLTKIEPSGVAIFDVSGKILKGENYRPPDLSDLV